MKTNLKISKNEMLKNFELTEFKSNNIAINLYCDNLELKPVVKVNEKVENGQIIAELNDKKLLSPFCGTVKEITKLEVNQTEVSTCIFLEKSEEENKNKPQNLSEILSLENPKNMLVNYGLYFSKTFANFFEKILSNEPLKNIVLNCNDFDKFCLTNHFLFNNYFKDFIEIFKTIHQRKNFDKLVILSKDFDKVNELNELKDNCDFEILLKNKKLFKGKKDVFINCFDIYKLLLLNLGEYPCYDIVTVGGDCISEQKILKVFNGTILVDIYNFCGGVKFDYAKVEAFKYNAMEALNDEIEFNKQLDNEQDEEKKKEIIKLRDEKKQEAQEKIFSKREEYYDYFMNCLGLVFIEKENTTDYVYDMENPLEINSTALIFISNNECKKRKIKK